MQKEKSISIEYLKKSEINTVHEYIFYILPQGKIEFFHMYNLLLFRYKGKAKVNYLININIKNQKTYELIQILYTLQKKFIKTNNLQYLKYISHQDILDLHKMRYNTFLSKPVISLILNNTKYLDQNNQTRLLNYLTPRKHFIQYIKIKQILNSFPDASDNILKINLLAKYQIDISCVQISKIRKRYCIPNKSKRNLHYRYLKFESYFSQKTVLFNNDSIKNKKFPAVYELLSSNSVEYNYDNTCTLYIGSSQNLYKRLNEYLNSYGHTQKLKTYLQSNIIYYRYIKTDNHKVLESELLHDFEEFYGSLPHLNTNKIK